MESIKQTKHVIDTRGRLYFANPSYVICASDQKKGSAFKKLVSLADEAATAKMRLSQTVETGHPLSSTLKGMNCVEAISSLLAFTAAYLGSSPGAIVGLVNQEAVALTGLKEVTAARRHAAEKTEPSVMGAIDELGLDDESFEAFASFPGTKG